MHETQPFNTVLWESTTALRPEVQASEMPPVSAFTVKLFAGKIKLVRSQLPLLSKCSGTVIERVRQGLTQACSTVSRCVKPLSVIWVALHLLKWHPRLIGIHLKAFDNSSRVIRQYRLGNMNILPERRSSSFPFFVATLTLLTELTTTMQAVAWVNTLYGVQWKLLHPCSRRQLFCTPPKDGESGAGGNLIPEMPRDKVRCQICMRYF